MHCGIFIDFFLMFSFTDVSIGLMTHCESGVEADISTSSSSLERVSTSIS